MVVAVHPPLRLLPIFWLGGTGLIEIETAIGTEIETTIMTAITTTAATTTATMTTTTTTTATATMTTITTTTIIATEAETATEAVIATMIVIMTVTAIAIGAVNAAEIMIRITIATATATATEGEIVTAIVIMNPLRTPVVAFVRDPRNGLRTIVLVREGVTWTTKNFIRMRGIESRCGELEVLHLVLMKSWGTVMMIKDGLGSALDEAKGNHTHLLVGETVGLGLGQGLNRRGVGELVQNRGMALSVQDRRDVEQSDPKSCFGFYTWKCSKAVLLR